MKEKNKIQKIKDDYNDIKIPKELDNVVNDALNKKSKNDLFKKSMIVAASISVIFIGSINISPSFADTLESIPVIGGLVKVVNLDNYNINKNGFEVAIEVPKIEGLKDKELENQLNNELQKEAKDLYNEYLTEMKELEKANIEGRDLVESWHEVLTDNDRVFSMVIYNFHAQGSSNTTRKFYNIDKKNETAMTLKSLFEGKDYVNIISENIKEQMLEQMKNNPNIVYWMNSEMPDMDFKQIDEEQGFYVNSNGELVICFDKYDVAPGSMGLVEFVIPKDVINPLN